MSTLQLPVASRAHVLATARVLLHRHRRALGATVASFAGAAVAGLTSPWLLGLLVDALTAGTTPATIAALSLGMLLGVVGTAVLRTMATRLTTILGERVFAELRDDFMEDVTRLPLSTVEHAGTGDLLGRTTSDIDALSGTIRSAVPQLLVSSVTVLLTFAAAFLVSPLVALALLLSLPPAWIVGRWYLRRAPAAYLRERDSFGGIFGAITETVDGARTVDALRLGAVRMRAIDRALAVCWAARRGVLRLRLVLLPVTSLACGLPIVAVIAWGGSLAIDGLVSAGTVAAIALYAVQIVTPVENLIRELAELQLGAASLARILGVSELRTGGPANDSTGTEVRLETDIRLDGVHHAYPGGPEVLHGVTLHLVRGERIALVGPSGAGKSTIGRILAGIDAPTAGSATVGGLPLASRPIEQLRREVALVTQEHHVFVGSVADNVRLGRVDATPGDVERALATVGADGWVSRLPAGVDTVVGSGGHPVSSAQAQELALARLVLADPHTIVLDEATSVLDARSARRLERSLAAVLTGRTVVAIAHRLHTAYDADRIAVLEEGRITELGSHHELLAGGGSYAALWHSWRDDGPISNSHSQRSSE